MNMDNKTAARLRFVLLEDDHSDAELIQAGLVASGLAIDLRVDRRIWC
jgi:hypothetical protein